MTSATQLTVRPAVMHPKHLATLPDPHGGHWSLHMSTTSTSPSLREGREERAGRVNAVESRSVHCFKTARLCKTDVEITRGPSPLVTSRPSHCVGG